MKNIVVNQKMEISIPDGFNFVRIGHVLKNEYFLDVGNSFCKNYSITRPEKWKGDNCSSFGYVILTKIQEFDWPDFINYLYLAKDIHHNWYGFFFKPEIRVNNCRWESGHSSGNIISKEGFNIKFPVVDWKDSLLQNPNGIKKDEI